MGCVSLLNDIHDRYYGADSYFENWEFYYDRDYQLPPVQGDRPVDPLDRARRVIAECCQYFAVHEEVRQNLTPRGYWELHYRNVDALYEIMTELKSVANKDLDAWTLLMDIENRLRAFFRTNPVYGPLSPNVLERVLSTSREIRSRSVAVEQELKQFHDLARNLLRGDADEELRTALKQFVEIRERLENEEKKRKHYFERAEQVREWGEQFLRLRAQLAVKNRYRPAFKDLNRLDLNEHQEGFVRLNHDGAYRIQGASGSGKTVILIHRALQLALGNPSAFVRVFTINRSLAELLRESIKSVNGNVPQNLDITAFYDFLSNVQLARFGVNDNRGLADPVSSERIAGSWLCFFNHQARTPQQNVFASPEVQNLVDSLVRRRGVDPCKYLRDEIVYIQSAYLIRERDQYLSEQRKGRGIPLNRENREACLRVLDAWEEWLKEGALCDVDRLTLRAGLLFETTQQLQWIRETFPTDHVLADEAQDFSTQELRILRRLVADTDGPNRFFFVGDLNQKVFAKQHASTRAGFNFTGRSRILAQNYRNTREILRAASRLPQRYPPQADEDKDIEIVSPKLSQYEGGRPIVLACQPVTHPDHVLDIVRQLAGQRVAIVSENDSFLSRVREQAPLRHIYCYDLFTVGDLDLWRSQQGGSLNAALVVSRLEAVKGFEFDTVIACDLSDGVIPRPGTPPEEYWRDAAVLYAALTRARNQLVMTYIGQRSVFLDTMANDIDFLDGIEKLTQVLNVRGAVPGP